MIKDFYSNNRPILIEDKLMMSVMKNTNSMPDSSTINKLEKESFIGLLPLSVTIANSYIQYKYLIGSRISLQEYFSEETVDSDEAYQIFKNMSDVLIDLKKKSLSVLNMNNCMLNSEYIFINKITKEIYYLYIPFKHNFEEVNFGEYIHGLVENIIFKDPKFLDSLMLLLQEKKHFTVENFRTFLDSLKNAPSEPEPKQPEVPLIHVKPYLFSRDGTQKHIIDKPRYNIGKLEDNDLIIDIFGITRHAHAFITVENEEYYLCDASSANGTLLNGSQIEKGVKYKLNDSDVIALRGLTDDQKAYKEIIYIFRLEQHS